VRNKQWAALRQRLIQDGLPTSVLDRLAISIGAHAAGVHAMMNQVHINQSVQLFLGLY
jgi:hypothetical protein